MASSPILTPDHPAPKNEADRPEVPVRFAYIDDEGRQVQISSMAELANRVRLGAIHDQTELYDAVEDRWLTARDHDGYVAARDALDDDVDTAPLPEDYGTVFDSPDPDPGLATSDDEAALERDWNLALKDELGGLAPSPPGIDPGPDVTLPAPPPPSLDAAATSEDEPQPEGDLDGFDWGIVPDGSSGANESTADQRFSSADAPPVGRGSDMETIAGASNVFEGFENPPQPAGKGAGALGSLGFDDEATAQRGSGMKFEQFMPKPEAAPAESAPWNVPPEPEPQPAEAGEDDFFLIDELDVEPDVLPTSGTRRRRKSRVAPGRVAAIAGAAAFVVILTLAVPRLLELGNGVMGERAGPDDPVSTRLLDALPAYLRTEARLLSQAAMDQTLDGLRDIRRNLGVEGQPPRDWMEGVYFAHGSRYPAAQSYWERYRSYLAYGQRELPVLFEAAFRAEVAASGIRAEDREAVVNAAVDDFASRAQARELVFSRLTGLANASLDLHEFLVLKEEEIEYAPFTRSGVSKDPILEAVPSTEQTRVDLWERLERVTRRLEELGALERVTTDRLEAILFEELLRIEASAEETE